MQYKTVLLNVGVSTISALLVFLFSQLYFFLGKDRGPDIKVYHKSAEIRGVDFKSIASMLSGVEFHFFGIQQKCFRIANCLRWFFYRKL